MPAEPNSFLCEIDRPETVTAVSHALTSAGIPYQTALLNAGGARVVMFVPWRRLDDARQIVTPFLGRLDEPAFAADGHEEDDDEDAGRRPRLPAPGFPWGPVQAVASMVLMHLGLVFWAGSSLPGSPNLVRSWGIIGERTAAEPWRILTAMFVHVDPSHALWNGVSLLVFAVPLLGMFGYRRTVLIYLAAGLGGGMTAYAFLAPGSAVVGSSGAVAGLFGAWLVQAWQQGARDTISWRGKIRSLGIAVLVLPSLISPVNAAGDPISVSSHLGGLLTGMLVGAVISRRWSEHSEPLEFDDPAETFGAARRPYRRSADR